DPNAKARFLNGRTNRVGCPRCGAVIQLSVPIVYHDHTKELLLIYFPQEMNIPKNERERIVGEMTRAIMNSLPQEMRKGYLFNPITPLTYEGMLETVLEKDGVTREMMDAQRQKMAFVEQIATAEDDALPTLVQKHDADMDEEFFQLLGLYAEM